MGIGAMKTIQMTIDEALLQKVDQAVGELNTTRSALIREALERTLRHYQILKLEQQDVEGYQRTPAHPVETDDWIAEQAWGDEWNEAK
jgi:metal-responsive CopG/Arc/MetJ family transcriptional regulator